MANFRDINSTLKYVAQYTSGCSDSIKKTQLDSVTVTADIYYQQCQTEGMETIHHSGNSYDNENIYWL